MKGALSLPIVFASGTTFVGMFLFFSNSFHLGYVAMFASLLWLSAFYFGSTYRYWLIAISPNLTIRRSRDWHSGQLLASFILLASTFIFHIHYHFTLPATVLLSYSIAKFECLSSGCCGIACSEKGLQIIEILIASSLAISVAVFSENNYFGLFAMLLFTAMRTLSCVLQNNSDILFQQLSLKTTADGLFLFTVVRL